MPRTIYALKGVGVPSKDKVRSSMHLPSKHFDILSELTDYMRDLRANECRLHEPKPAYLSSCVAWAQFSTAGRTVLERLSAENRFAEQAGRKPVDVLVELGKAFDQYKTDTYSPGACNDRLRTKFSATHMAGEVVSILLERYGAELLQELKARAAASAVALSKR